MVSECLAKHIVSNLIFESTYVGRCRPCINPARCWRNKNSEAPKTSVEVPFHNDQPTQGEVRWSQTYCRDPDFVRTPLRNHGKVHVQNLSLIFECVTG